MSTCQATGAADAQLAIAPGAGAALFSGDPTNGLRLFPKTITLKEMTEERVREVLRGTADLDASDVDPGNKNVTGGFTLEPGRAELDVLLPLIMGQAEGDGVGENPAVDEFEIAAGLLPFRAITQRGSLYDDFRDLYVNTWELTGSSGGSLQLAVETIGKTKTSSDKATHDALVATSAVPTVAARSIAFAEGGLTVDVGGSPTTVPIADFRIRGDNRLSAAFYSSDTAQCIDRDDLRALTYRFLIPQNATTKAIIAEGYLGRSGVLSFVAADSTEFTVTTGALTWPNETPEVNGPGRLFIELEGRILSDGDTPALSITNNPVPA